jgi:predicted NBD/HSP70 family sugar kinase
MPSIKVSISKVSELVEGNLDHISIEVIVEAAKENDALAFPILQDAIFHIGIAVADVINLLSPIATVVGAAFRGCSDPLLEPLKRVIRQRALENSAHEVQFMISSLGSDAAALGAVRLVSEKVLQSLYEERI